MNEQALFIEAPDVSSMPGLTDVMAPPRLPRVAIIHDWLVTYAGAERVLEQIIACFPHADLFSLVDFVENRAFLHSKPVRTSFIQHLPFARKHYRAYLPLMPLAIEQFDMSGYDLVISSSHAVAKGVLTGPDQIHVSYVHSPIRYAWDLQHQYLNEAHLTKGLRSVIARMILHYIRNWDSRTSNSVDKFIANSQFIARRIKKVYRRDAQVIFPPVDIDLFKINECKEDFYLTASRMAPYKKMDLIVEAFASMPDKKLFVIGEGPQMRDICEKAASNVEILGYQSFASLHEWMRRAKAFVFAAEEDFGIVVVEAQACGTPVIAFGKGGATETVRDLSDDHPTGVFFGEQSVSAIVAAVEQFEHHIERFSAHACRANAERFAVANFRERFVGCIERVLREASQSIPLSHTSPTRHALDQPRIKKSLKVLTLDQSGELGGAELSLLDVARHLKTKIEVALFEDGPFRLALEEAGVAVDVLGAGSSCRIRKKGSLFTLRALIHTISLVREVANRARTADLIYANTQRAMVIGALAGLIVRKPVVWHLRDIVSAEHFGKMQRRVIKVCGKWLLKRVIANSTASANAFHRLTNHRGPSVNVVVNGISEAPFIQIESTPQSLLRERLNLPQQAFIAGSFSRIAPWKGQHVLLEAALFDPDLHLVFVGAPLFDEHEYEAQLKAFVSAHHMASRVHFLGFRDDVPACMKAVDVIVHTSIAAEPFGRVIVEGLLAKRPVIAARAGGVVEIVEDGVSALLFEPGNVQALAERLFLLRNTPSLRARLVENGYAVARRKFSSDTYIAKVECILNEVALQP